MQNLSPHIIIMKCNPLVPIKRYLLQLLLLHLPSRYLFISIRMLLVFVLNKNINCGVVFDKMSHMRFFKSNLFRIFSLMERCDENTASQTYDVANGISVPIACFNRREQDWVNAHQNVPKLIELNSFRNISFAPVVNVVIFDKLSIIDRVYVSYERMFV